MHHKSQSHSPSRKPYSMPSPSYREALAMSGGASTRAHSADSRGNRVPPPPYNPSPTPKRGLSIMASPGLRQGSFRGAATSRSSQAKGTGFHRRSASAAQSSTDFSPGSRAVNARAAARDAQMSAERALAAAAAASRAADLAAHAAIQVRRSM